MRLKLLKTISLPKKKHLTLQKLNTNKPKMISPIIWTNRRNKLLNKRKINSTMQRQPMMLLSNLLKIQMSQDLMISKKKSINISKSQLMAITKKRLLIKNSSSLMLRKKLASTLMPSKKQQMTVARILKLTKMRLLPLTQKLMKLNRILLILRKK